jgi:hypothetical protein
MKSSPRSNATFHLFALKSSYRVLPPLDIVRTGMKNIFKFM